MNYHYLSQVVLLLSAVAVEAQYQTPVQEPAPSSSYPAFSDGQIQSQIQNFNANGYNTIDYGNGQYLSAHQAQRQEVQSYAASNGYAISQLPQSIQENLAARSASMQEFRASVSAAEIAQGYTAGVSAIPSAVRQSFISSVLAAKSGDIQQMQVSVSSFMATQTQINTVSLAQAISSIAATATAKPKKRGFFKFKKNKKAGITPTDSYLSNSTATATGLSSGFKSFFKNIQMKIKKSSDVASVATVTSATAPAPAPAPTPAPAPEASPEPAPAPAPAPTPAPEPTPVPAPAA